MSVKDHHNFLLYHVRQNFPYEDEGVLKEIQDKLIMQMDEGLNPKKRYDELKAKFSSHLENISSSKLYHFTGSLEYLITALKREALYPSFIGHEEYFGFNFKKFYLPYNLMDFNNIEEIELKIEQQKKACKESDWEDLPEIVKKSQLPIYSCFTEMPETSLPFHSHHYGFWGIAFNKGEIFGSDVISKHMDQRTQSNPLHYGFYPVSYVDSYGNKAFEYLLRSFLEEIDFKVRGDYAFEVLKFKPISIHQTSHENFYSAYFEREWRYISNKKPFTFAILEHVDSIFVDSLKWSEFIEFKKQNPTSLGKYRELKELYDLVTAFDLKVSLIERINLD